MWNRLLTIRDDWLHCMTEYSKVGLTNSYSILGEMVSDIECSKVRLMKEVSSRYSTLVRMVYRTLSTPKVKHKKELTSND